MLLCSKDHVLTQDNECVENKRINCNPGSEFSYYNDPIFRTCMQCVNEDLSHTCNCVEGQYADTDGECVQCEE